MSTDKLFILLLVVLLPLSGCLDTVEPAGAESNDDDDDSDAMLTLHIQSNDIQWLPMGDRTLKLETMYQLWQDPDCGGGDDGNNEHCPQTWNQYSQAMPINMICGEYSENPYFEMNTTIYTGQFLPILHDNCEIRFSPEGNTKESILIFSSHPVAILGTATMLNPSMLT